MKKNQPTLYEQLHTLPWHKATAKFYDRTRGHGRLETRVVQALTVTDLGVSFPHAAQAAKIVRHRTSTRTGKRTRETVYVITDLTSRQASPETIARLVRSHWVIENRLHFVRDVTFDEDRSQVRTGPGPENMATLRNLAINKLRAHGHANIAAGLREMSYEPFPALSTSSASPRDQQLRHDQGLLQQPWQSARVSLYHRRSRKTVAGCRPGAEIPQLEFQRRP
ncbi:ISAs1 family transposase [Streptomyces sp. NPDC006992]|uniref:ISAs1 family transposase n=1 Tax=Streptomyces sp. NPDC006992 TaxID=3155601 RepID=UPI0033F16F7C